MNSINWIRIAVVVVIFVLVSALVGMTNLYIDKRDELLRYEASVETLAKQATENAARVRQQHEQTLINVRKDYENRIPEIRNSAVAAYRATIRVRVATKPRGSGVPAAPVSVAVDAGAEPKCVLDEQFIQDAAEDAAKVGAWQQWCYDNHCPVADD